LYNVAVVFKNLVNTDVWRIFGSLKGDILFFVLFQTHIACIMITNLDVFRTVSIISGTIL